MIDLGSSMSSEWDVFRDAQSANLKGTEFFHTSGHFGQPIRKASESTDELSNLSVSIGKVDAVEMRCQTSHLRLIRSLRPKA